MKLSTVLVGTRPDSAAPKSRKDGAPAFHRFRKTTAQSGGFKRIRARQQGDGGRVVEMGANCHLNPMFRGFHLRNEIKDLRIFSSRGSVLFKSKWHFSQMSSG